MSEGFEQMVYELQHLKKKHAAIRQENMLLKTTAQRASILVKKKDRQIQHILDLKVGLSEKTEEATLANRLRAIKADMQAPSMLMAKIRELETAVAQKDEQLRMIKSSMKFTLIKELQIEAQTYYNEARRIKKLLDRINSSREDFQESGDRSLGRLRYEIGVMRKENSRLQSGRKLDEQNHSMLRTLRKKIESMQSELNMAKMTDSGDMKETKESEYSAMIVRQSSRDLRERASAPHRTPRQGWSAAAAAGGDHEYV
jgi:hypothetical protein